MRCAGLARPWREAGPGQVRDHVRPSLRIDQAQLMMGVTRVHSGEQIVRRYRSQLAHPGGGQTMSDLLVPGWACEDLNLGPLPYQVVLC